jgi:hypothetical protein
VVERTCASAKVVEAVAPAVVERTCASAKVVEAVARCVCRWSCFGAGAGSGEAKLFIAERFGAKRWAAGGVPRGTFNVKRGAAPETANGSARGAKL